MIYPIFVFSVKMPLTIEVVMNSLSEMYCQNQDACWVMPEAHLHDP